jgi:TRAP-type C4-dicarboxylate transport system permease small subunit
MKRFSAALAAIDKLIGNVLKTISVAFFIILTVILSLNIVNRFIPFTSFHWLDEIVELCFAGLVFYGAAAVWMTRGHFSAGDWISKRLSKPAFVSLYHLVVELLSLVFMAVLLKYSWQIMARSQEATAVFQIPKAVLYSCMPISAAIMVAYSIVRVIVEIRALLKPAGGEKA